MIAPRASVPSLARGFSTAIGSALLIILTALPPVPVVAEPIADILLKQPICYVSRVADTAVKSPYSNARFPRIICIFEVQIMRIARKSAKRRLVMTAIQELEPYISSYQSKMRKAKDTSGLTLDEIIARSGASESAVKRLYAGTQTDPKLFYSAAICKVLGLSLDELFGLSAPDGSAGDLQKRNHELELDNARLTAANEALRAQIRSSHSICYLLVFFCALLSVSLITYLVIDAQINNAGLIQGGQLSGVAWIFVAMIASSVIAAGFTILRIVRREGKDIKKDSANGGRAQ